MEWYVILLILYTISTDFLLQITVKGMLRTEVWHILSIADISPLSPPSSLLVISKSSLIQYPRQYVFTIHIFL